MIFRGLLLIKELRQTSLHDSACYNIYLVYFRLDLKNFLKSKFRNFVVNRIWSVIFCLSSLIIQKYWKITTLYHWRKYTGNKIGIFLFLLIKQTFSNKHNFSRLQTNTEPIFARSLFSKNRLFVKTENFSSLFCIKLINLPSVLVCNSKVIHLNHCP